MDKDKLKYNFIKIKKMPLLQIKIMMTYENNYNVVIKKFQITETREDLLKIL